MSHDVEFNCPPISETAKHASYVERFQDKLRADCESLSKCLDELYSRENILRILEGKGIALKHICSLVDPTKEEEDMFHCNEKERKTIRQDLQIHLYDIFEEVQVDETNGETTTPTSTSISTSTQQSRQNSTQMSTQNLTSTPALSFDSPRLTSPTETSTKRKGRSRHRANRRGKRRRKQNQRNKESETETPTTTSQIKHRDINHEKEWVDLLKCIERHNPKDDPVSAICSLQRSNTRVCGSQHVHHAVESFLNAKISRAQCECDALPKVQSKVPMIAGGVGGGVFVVLLVLLLCWMVRKGKSHRTEQGARYHINEQEENPSLDYSEIPDVTLPMNKEIARQNAQSETKYRPDLPIRNSKNTGVTTLAQNIEYMEPLDTPVFSLAEIDCSGGNAGAQQPEVENDDNNRGSYFVPLGEKTQEHKDCGYDTLPARNKAKKQAKDVVENYDLSSPDYFELEGKEETEM